MSSGFSSGPLSPSQPGFFLWESNEPVVNIPPLAPEAFTFSQDELVSSNSGSDTSNQDTTNRSSPGADKLDGSNCKTLSFGSDDAAGLTSTDERKRRRMISNRESARRSRMRKQEYFKDLRAHLCRLKVGNQDLTSRLRFSLHQTRFVRYQNECLQLEAAVLRQRLWDVRQVLIARQLQQQQHLNSTTATICMAMH